MDTTPTCWLCLDKGALAIHNNATNHFGRPLWTAHTPTSLSHPVTPCPACRPGEGSANNAEQPARTTPDNPATSTTTADNPLREQIAAVLRITPRADCRDHPPHGPHGSGHIYDARCALCTSDVDALTSALYDIVAPQQREGG